eukprot:COSAG02_NODE_20477_length_830_cov_1.039672_2_plen_44_part_01
MTNGGTDGPARVGGGRTNLRWGYMGRPMLSMEEKAGEWRTYMAE